jgi:Domain of unknown function (DUF4440)
MIHLLTITMTVPKPFLTKSLLVIAISLTAASLSTKGQSKQETEIAGIIERLRLASFLSDAQSMAERAADRASLEAILSDDYVRVSPKGTFLSKVEVLESYAPKEVSSVVYEHQRVFGFDGGTAIAICLARFEAPYKIRPWIIARVFTKHANTWRLIAEDAGPNPLPLLPEPANLPPVAPRNPLLRRNERAEEEVRALLERQRIANDPQAQRPFGRVMDRKAFAAIMASDYLKVWWGPNGWTNDSGPELARFDRERFAANSDPKATDQRHLYMNEPNASRTWENLNIAVIGTNAIVTYRNLSQQTDRRRPEYTVFRVYEKRAENWLMIFSFRG